MNDSYYNGGYGVLQDGFLIHLNKSDNERDAGLVLLLAMSVTGFVWIAATVFMEKPMPAPMIAAAAAAVCLPLIRNSRIRGIAMLLPVAAALIALAAARDFLNGGFLQMVNHCIRQYNYTRGTDVYYYTLSERGSGTAALAAAAALLILLTGYLFNYLLRGRHVRIFCILNALLILLVLFLRAENAYMACCFSAMSIPAAVMRNGTGAKSGRQFAICLAVLMVLGSAASVAYMKWGNFSESRAASDIKDSVMGRLDTWRYGEEDSYTGSLDKAAAYDPGDDVRLSVTASKGGTYYLKGFVGGTYENGGWEEIDPGNYNRYHEGMFDWLAGQGFIPLAQNSDYIRLITADIGGDTKSFEREITVKNENANRRFSYIPYGLSHDSAAALENVNHDMNVKGGAEEISYRADYYDMSTSLSLANPSWMADSSGDVAKYREAQEEYRDFVYEYYMDLDPDITRFLDKSLGKASQDDYVKQTIEIRNWLSDEKTANASAGDFGSKLEKDYLYYFMGRSRKGNSSFYASAAVMMYRYYGVPARYAEGYLANIKNGGEAESVTGKDIHAWPEIYKDGIGWIPVEVTPGYYDEIKLPQIAHRNDTEEPLPPQADPPKQDPEPKQEEGRMRFSTVDLLLTLLVLLAAIIAAILGRRYAILIRRREVLFGRNTDKAMKELMSYTDRLLTAGGLDTDSIPAAETDILMRYRFRDGTIARGDYEKLRDHAYALRRAVYKGFSVVKKLKMRYISVLK